MTVSAHTLVAPLRPACLGGGRLFAPQDEPHEEDVGEQATAEDEEEQDSGEWAAEEEHEEDEEVPVTEPGGPEGRNERDEPHEEDAGDQASAEEEEEQDSGEWAAEEEWRRREQCRERTYEEDEEVPATEVGRSEGSNECVSADRDESFLSYRPQTGRRTTRGASGASDTIQTTATSGGSINLLWETPCLPAI